MPSRPSTFNQDVLTSLFSFSPLSVDSLPPVYSAGAYFYCRCCTIAAATKVVIALGTNVVVVVLVFVLLSPATFEMTAIFVQKSAATQHVARSRSNSNNDTRT